MPKRPNLVQHWIYPISSDGGWSEPVPQSFRKVVASNRQSYWPLSSGFRQVEPGDLIWVYAALDAMEICGLGTVQTDPKLDKGEYYVWIKWNKKLTSALRKNPIPYDAYKQHVQHAVVGAKRDTPRVLESWLRKTAPGEYQQMQAVKFVRTEVNHRLGQGPFRDKVLAAYGGRCAISGCGESEVLEAAHIIPVTANGTHKIDNGLLLRADLHNLFDCGLIWIRPDHKVAVAPEITEPTYASLDGMSLTFPAGVARSRLLKALAKHRGMHND